MNQQIKRSQPESKLENVIVLLMNALLLVCCLLVAGCTSKGFPYERPTQEVLTDGGQSKEDVPTENSETPESTIQPEQPDNTSPKPPVPPTALPNLVRQRFCPSEARTTPFSSFTGKPCDPAQPRDKCLEDTQRCLPAGLPKAEDAASDFFDRCKDTNVLCVGPTQTTKTLTDALKQLQTNSKLDTLLIESGLYQESVTFKDIKRPLILEGQSNDPQKGVRIEAPVPAQADATHAALRFVNTDTITLTRLVFSGEGHGVYIEGATKATLTHTTHTNNRQTGAFFVNNKEVDISQCNVTQNGGNLVTAKDTSPQLAQLHFGLQFDRTTAVQIASCTIEYNGAGGVWVAPKDQIAVTVTNEHRILSDDQIAVTVTNEHRVTMDKVSLAHNGPASYARATNQPSGTCKTPCPAQSFCEAGVCIPQLVQRLKKNQQGTFDISTDGNGRESLLGVGAVLMGQGTITLRGNSVFHNDISGLLFVSAGEVVIQENVFARNGARAYAKDSDLLREAHPAIIGWGIQKSASMTYNLMIDNVAHAVKLKHMADSKGTPVSLLLQRNHISHNGHHLQSTQQASFASAGVALQSAIDGAGFTLDIKENAFFANAQAGLFTSGACKGSILTNLFEGHPQRSLVHHDNNNDAYKVAITKNIIRTGMFFGVQVHTSTASWIFDNNLVEQIKRAAVSKDDEGDGINISSVTKGTVLLENNILRKNQRSGLFVEKSSVTANNNLFSDNPYPIVSQFAQVEGTNKDTVTKTDATPLPNTKSP
ncbi:MAG TPA: hypothetical protein DCE42_01965 [Myxococcales bacterium]|nr:hypothetical protein [Deltaproteobacteria bacterium]MBU51700.1 hypothetical protein [Deltaproteobacteria bacterium]HAA53489.1 hypothetical protein [Myxococcales bacterium]|tara:strand:- start:13126 stop:15417 length:2292 start_codon:yes stop_codon:yes gene_type:complete